MSGEAQCYCCESGTVSPLDRALDELGMLAAVPAGRRQHQAESRRRRRYTVSAVQRRTPAGPGHMPPATPSGSSQIAEQMSRIRLDGGGGGGGTDTAERHAFETLYINWDYVSGVGVGPAERRPAGGKARRSWTRPAKPYSADRPSGGRARTSSWSQQELAGIGGPPPPTGAENERQSPPDAAPAPAAATVVTTAGPLVRSLSLENLKLGELSPAAPGPARLGPDVETISRRIEGLRVEYQ